MPTRITNRMTFKRHCLVSRCTRSGLAVAPPNSSSRRREEMFENIFAGTQLLCPRLFASLTWTNADLKKTSPDRCYFPSRGQLLGAARRFQVLLLAPTSWSDPMQIPDMKSSWSLSFSRFCAPSIRSVLRVESASYFMQLGCFVYYSLNSMATPRSWRAPACRKHAAPFCIAFKQYRHR